MLLFHAELCTTRACLEHSYFLKVKVKDLAPHNKVQHVPLERARCTPCTHHLGGRASPGRTPTTSFLTATTLIYAIGAGITAAAGTRLALQLILGKGFKLFSFQLQDMKPHIGISCHYLPVSGLGNLRACCLP